MRTNSWRIVSMGGFGVPPDPETSAGAMLATAQGAIWSAMNGAGLNQTELAAKMGKHKSYITRILKGDHNLTIKTFASALAACGVRTDFDRKPITAKWATSYELESPGPDDSLVGAA